MNKLFLCVVALGGLALIACGDEPAPAAAPATESSGGEVVDAMPDDEGAGEVADSEDEPAEPEGEESPADDELM